MARNIEEEIIWVMTASRIVRWSTAKVKKKSIQVEQIALEGIDFGWS